MIKYLIFITALVMIIPCICLGYSYCGYKWKTSNPMGEKYLVYANTNDCTGELASVQAAAAEWNVNGHACFDFTYGGSTTRSAPSYDNYNVIRWNNLSGGTIAATYIWVYTSDRTSIAECDLVFNDRFNWNSGSTCPSNKMDVQNIATHELGHFLCLGDLYGGGDAQKTMYGYADNGETKKRSLEADDKAGIQYIYGYCQ